MSSDLEGWFQSVLIKDGRRTVRNASPEREKKLESAKTFTDPHRWHSSRFIALIHMSDDPPAATLLGNFEESFHDSGARKLTRVTHPVATTGIEYVRGDWWLNPHQESALKNPERWVETKELFCPITLAEVGLHCVEAHIRVRLEFNGIARVELLETTRFTCPDRNTHMFLPAGLDVLSCMTFDAKLGLRAELRKDLPEDEEDDAI